MHIPDFPNGLLEELRRSKPENVGADAAQLAEALIVQTGDAHWSDSARNLIKGLTLHLYDTDPAATLGTLRNLLSATPQDMAEAFQAMVDSKTHDGAAARVGSAFLSMIALNEKGQPKSFTKELASILSTARQQTAPLDDLGRVIGGRSGFMLADFAAKNATIYLVLPGMRLGTHYQWLRLVLMQALAAMEQNPIPRGKWPAWFVLEEFAALGHVRAIETAAGYMAGFGVKLWAVLQDLTQLQNHYKQAWETFLGNAGAVLAFGNVDATTTEYLSKLLGQTMVTETRSGFASMAQRDAGDDGTRKDVRAVPLLASDEIARHFGRKTHRALVHVPGERPVYLMRLPFQQARADA